MRFRCNKCGDWPKGLHEFESDAPICPRCGAAGQDCAPLVDVHLIVVDPKGQILSTSGRLQVACDTKRDHLAVKFGPCFSATPDASLVTCPRCKGTPAYLERIKPHEELMLRRALERQQVGNPVTDCGCK